jgi:CelD/BcsL family acetyltransferase involved in cellulose biosynthesis
MIASPLTIEIVRDAQRFSTLSDTWDLLAARVGTPLARHAWYIAALGSLQQHTFEISVVLVWDGIQLAAAAPLMLDKAHLPARLVPIDAFAGEPFQLLYRDSEALAALACACAGLNRPILFRRLQSSETDLELLSTALRSGAALFCKPRHISATVQLPVDVQSFEANMSSNRRSGIRRKWRVVKREHVDVVTEFVTPNPEDVAMQLARIEALEGSGWKQRSGTALSADPRMGGFVSRLASAFANEGQLVLAFLKIDGRDVAGRLILREQSGWFEIKIGFDEGFARFVPGILLMHETLCEACRRGITSFALLGVYEGWQDNWPHEVTEDFRVATYPLRPSGAIALAADCWQAVSSFFRRF